MTFIQKDGLNFFDGLNKEYIAVESDRLDIYVNYINENNIKAIGITDENYSLEDINFLSKCPKVEKISIEGTNVKNYIGLYSLINLKVLFIGEPRNKVDLSKLELLEELYVDMNMNIIGLEKCYKLKKIGLWKYKPRSKDLSELFELVDIEELEITQSNKFSYGH